MFRDLEKEPAAPRARAAALRIVTALLVLAVPAVALAHGDVMHIGSSAAGGGKLAIEPEFDFDLDVYLTQKSQPVGSRTRYYDIFPSFGWVLAPAATGELFPLGDGVEVRFTVREPVVAPGSVVIRGRILDAPGENALLGEFSPVPDDHVHPEWQAIETTGVVGRYDISFQLSTAAPGYTDSDVYTLTLTNAEPPATPTATSTPTSTPTPPAAPSETPTAETTATPSSTLTETPSVTPIDTALPESTPTPSPSPTPTPTEQAIACAGDCNGDSKVTIDELIYAVDLAMKGGGVGACAAVDRSGDGKIGIDELVRAVEAGRFGCEAG